MWGGALSPGTAGVVEARALPGASRPARTVPGPGSETGWGWGGGRLCSSPYWVSL